MPSRPELPLKHQNPHLKSLNVNKLPPVKYQSLDRDGHEVLVGRLKIPTPIGHAFILRRYDTGAISLTTMFRAAFPTASEADERREIQWAKEAHNLAGTNGSTREPHIVRLAGTWISPGVAISPDFADSYSLVDIVALIADATPDPSANYRRANRTTPRGPPPTSPVMGPVNPLLTPAPSMAAPTPKRRRESLPVVSSPPPPPPQSTLPPPRRSARTKSPAALPAPVGVKSPKATRVGRSVRMAEVITPGGSDETAVEEAETIEMARPSMSQDIAEQMELLEKLKAERDDHKTATDEAALPLKRAREDDEKKGDLRFSFKEPETEERKIATNKRVSRFHLEPRQKSFAWGVAAFAVGIGAVSFLPNFF